MKRFLTFCLVTGAILLGAGLAIRIFAGTGLLGNGLTDLVEQAAGGRFSPEEFLRGLKAGTVSLEELLGGSVDVSGFSDKTKGILDQFLEEVSGEGFYKLEEGDVFDRGHDTITGVSSKQKIEGDVRDLELHVGGFAVSLVESDDDALYWEVSGTTGKIQVYVDGETLHMNALYSGAELGADDARIGENGITLYVPAAFVWREFEAELGAGLLQAAGLRADEIALEADAGQIVIEGCEARRMEVKAGAGGITLSGVSVTELEGSVGMGILHCSGYVGEKAELECAMGEVVLSLPGAPEDYNYRVECAAGQISLGDDSYSGMTGEKKITNGDGLPRIGLECAMGSIAVKFE